MPQLHIRNHHHDRLTRSQTHLHWEGEEGREFHLISTISEYHHSHDDNDDEDDDDDDDEVSFAPTLIFMVGNVGCLPSLL